MGKPSKYAHVTGTLPRLGIEPERRAIVEQVKTEILAPVNEGDPPYTLFTVNLDDADDCVTNAVAIAKRLTRGKRHASTLADAYVQMRVFMDKVNAWKSSVQVLVDTYEMLMIEQFEVESVALMRLESGTSISTFVEPYGQVKDKEAFRQWCIANGYESQLQLWPGTMNSVTKERLLAGEATPTGVEVFAKTVVRVLNKP